MNAENDGGVIERAGINQRRGSVTGFFRRLKQYAHRAGKRLFLRFQQNRRAERRRGVEIVAAGVHHTGILRGVIHAGLFFNWQSIDIRT